MCLGSFMAGLDAVTWSEVKRMKDGPVPLHSGALTFLDVRTAVIETPSAWPS
jgi:hypothetical protein